MITLEDCAAFCEADSSRVAAVAKREGLVMIMAYAYVHTRYQSANEYLGVSPPVTPEQPRLAA